MKALVAFLYCVAVLAIRPTFAQCAGHWSIATSGGVNGTAFASLALPNGDLLVGGTFTVAGGVSVNNIAVYHRSTDTWGDLAGGVIGTGGTGGVVNALLLMPNGDVIVGGYFAQAGSGAGAVSSAGIARWDGSSWHSIGGGTFNSGHSVLALALLPSGNLVVGGAFSFYIGSYLTVDIAVWDFSTATWSALTTGAGFDAPVRALAVLPSGDLVAGGDFQTIDVANMAHISRYDFTAGQWFQMSSGVHVSLSSLGVRALAILPSGALLAGGGFDTVGTSSTTANGIATWTSAGGWQAIDPTAVSDVNAVAVFSNGTFAVGGYFVSSPRNHVTIYDGTSFVGMNNGVNGDVFSLSVLSNNDLAVVGSFTSAGGSSVTRVVIWSTHPLCRVDWDCSGTLDSNDIFAFIASWFAGDPAANFNLTGALDPQDIFDFLDAWFAGC